MVNKRTKGNENLFIAVLMTHAILFFHLLLIAGLLFMVLFFRGLIPYMVWIALAAALLFILSGFFLYRRIKARGKQTLDDLEKSPLFGGRSFEVSFLSGLASLKFGRQDRMRMIENGSPKPPMQLEDPETIRIRELTELARLFEKNLISSEEYDRAKNQIFKFL